MSKEKFETLNQAKDFIKNRLDGIISPSVGVVLGTGLGEIEPFMEVCCRIDYNEIPHFPLSTVDSHKGKILAGRMGGKDILVLQGRIHLYEGYSPFEVCFGVRVLGLVGCSTFIITNAAGALNPLFEKGNLMIITDHINFTGQNPLVGKNIEELGDRFPDMSRAYDRGLVELATSSALSLGIKIEKGVYVGVLGPSLETPAETRALRMLGADAVGMSTVMEVIAARHMDKKILGISCLTNKNLPDCMEETSFEDVVSQAKKSGGKLIKLIREILKNL